MESSYKAKVALDTNMLTAMLGLKIDVFEEIKRKLGKVEFIVVRQTLDELETRSYKSMGTPCIGHSRGRGSRYVGSVQIPGWDDDILCGFYEFCDCRILYDLSVSVSKIGL